MITSRNLNHAVAFVLLILLACPPVWASYRDVALNAQLYPSDSDRRRPGQAPAGANLLEVVPAESIFCLRINNFEYTVNMMDQFLMGITPMPLMLSVGLREQLGGLLGNPQLGGVNMNGTFGVFVVPMPGVTDPNAEPFVGVLVPLTDFNVFVNSNPNVTQPDAQGVSQITVQGQPVMVVTQAGGFALVTGAEYHDALVTVAVSILSGRSMSLANTIDPAEAQATEPVWAYINAQKAMSAFGPLLADQIGAAMSMQGGMGPGGQMQPGFGLEMGLGEQERPGFGFEMEPGKQEQPGFGFEMEPGKQERPGFGFEMEPDKQEQPGFGFEMEPGIGALTEDMQVQSVILGLNPTANVLTITARVSAIPGTELAQTLVRGSEQLQDLFDAVGAKAPGQMGPEFSAVSAILPNAVQADYVGTYDLMSLFALAATFSPIPLPVPDANVPSKSSIAYAVKVDAGRMAVDIALPKEHLTEIMAGIASMEEPMVIGDETAMVEDSPLGMDFQVEPEITLPDLGADTGLFGGEFGDMTTTAPQRREEDSNVRVAGARLVRYSDFDLGVLPLGQGDGYTLALIAELPGPAVKVSGGRVDKAVTNTGTNLLPESKWDRRIKFARLSKDRMTAVFDVELLLPDPGAIGLAELSGTLEYMTAGRIRDVDLGAMTLKAGAKGSGLGAKISSIEADPYRDNATVVGLTVDLPPEAVESVEFFAENGTKLAVRRRGHLSIGGATTLKLFVDGELPPKAVIVLHIFEALEKNELSFRIVGISLVGQPIR